MELGSMSSAMEEKEVAVKFVKLQDGRQIAYREQGVTAPDATRRSLPVLHGIASSCLAGMPGVSDDLLKELNVRLVAIDQPGYGRSDKNPKQTMATFAKDIAELADLLQLGEKFWLLRYYFGGAYTGQLHTISLNALQELQCGHLLVITGGRDNLGSAKKMYFSLGCDLCLITRDWGFEISDLPKVYQGPLHIWNGDQDLLVNIDLQRCIKKLIPEVVHLHPVVGEGHLSVFCSNEKIHCETLTALLGVSGGAATEVFLMKY